ncbi:hypothetical protein BX600DRAFT_459362 [Xylariales sp. PMI_506]|nr:hypothetical protein BX600DRAFT_459362 [Xylariales sp. PMI_506]
MSTDGTTLWATARDSNQLLAFEVDKLVHNQTSDALLTTVQTGTSPAGVALVGDFVLTADSNRFGYLDASTGVTVVDA